MKINAILISILGLLTINSFSLIASHKEGNKPLKEQISVKENDFDKTLLTFDLTFHNPNNKSIHLTKVGIKSSVFAGEFMCASASRGLTPMADYIVRFHVGDPETIIEAEPILEIKPKSSIRYTISIIPRATGACGYWATNISAISIFDNDTRVESSHFELTSSDFEKYKMRIPKNEELLKALKHRNLLVRLEAIQKLGSSNIPKLEASDILEIKLNDNNPEIQLAAAAEAVEMHLPEHFETIYNNYFNENDYLKGMQYSELFSKMLPPSNLSKLISILGEDNGVYDFYYKLQIGNIKNALIKWMRPEVVPLLRDVLIKRKDWALIKNIGDTNLDKLKYICSILIKYRDEQSISIIKDILENEKSHPYIVRSILENIKDLHDEDFEVKGNFSLSMKNNFLALTRSKEKSIREPAIDLSCMVFGSTEEINNMLTSRYEEETGEYVKETMLKWGVRFRLTYFKEPINKLKSKCKDNYCRNRYDEMLKKLK